MRKFFFLITISVIVVTTSAHAQGQQEQVHLKDGSVIKGFVIEQVPNSSLKIQTSDGSIFSYKMNDVEKITKAPNEKGSNKTDVNIKYRGFVDTRYTLGVGLGSGLNRAEIHTSHGIQIIPQLFIGAGVGVGYFYRSGEFTIPIFANIRTDILKSKVTPFVDVKIGYSVYSISGLYFSPSIGCKINRFNIGFGYTLQNINFYGWNVGNVGGLSIKFGYEF